MPKTTSQTLFRRYPPLLDISESEWDEVFDKDADPWSQEDDEYVRDWYGKRPIVELSYALGRTPWKVAKRANVMGIFVGRGHRINLEH